MGWDAEFECEMYKTCMISGFFSLHGDLDDLLQFHLYYVDEVLGHLLDLSFSSEFWLDPNVHNLFNDSLLEPVLNHVDCFSVFSNCCVIFLNLTTFTTTCGSLVSTICSTTRFGILERVVPLARSE